MKTCLVICLAWSVFAAVGCKSEEVAPTDVSQIQKEAKSGVPSNLGTVPPEKATAGAVNFGAKKKGG